jgi:hypothetical protein
VLGREVRLRYLPELEFLEDESAMQGARIEEILRSATPPAAEPPSEAARQPLSGGELGPPPEPRSEQEGS